ncbi:MAG: AMP-binding protein, partial [Acidobacteria bacterium]|nr:AMP-binding protein [Acidobacteriota bacterium]
RELPIGRPVGETELLVLDNEQRPVPAGVVGELYVGGAGLARGYLGRLGATAERFVPHLFAEEAGARLYRTGDRARWRASGELEFLGRQDDQVKIRGFRVEPGEVESVLSRHPGIREVAVVPVLQSSGAYRLVAYLAEGEGGRPEVAELRAFVGESLPEYMVPSVFSWLSALPLTANGKVDRAALAALEVGEAESAAGYVAPRTEAERALAGIFAEVLSVERVGVEEDFFTLGGDSILSLQITSRAQRAGLQVTPRQVFEHPTVAALARVAGTAAQILRESEPVVGPVPLLPIQRWFLEAGLESRHHTNLPVLLKLGQRLEAGVVEAVLEKLQRAHDALRLAFEEGEGGWEAMAAAPEETPL